MEVPRVDGLRELTLRIVAPHFVAGVTPGNASMTAPIVRYMATWSEARIRAYCARKRWACEVLP